MKTSILIRSVTILDLLEEFQASLVKITDLTSELERAQAGRSFIFVDQEIVSQVTIEERIHHERRRIQKIILLFYREFERKQIQDEFHSLYKTRGSRAPQFKARQSFEKLIKVSGFFLGGFLRNKKKVISPLRCSYLVYSFLGDFEISPKNHQIASML